MKKNVTVAKAMKIRKQWKNELNKVGSRAEGTPFGVNRLDTVVCESSIVSEDEAVKKYYGTLEKHQKEKNEETFIVNGKMVSYGEMQEWRLKAQEFLTGLNKLITDHSSQQRILLNEIDGCKDNIRILESVKDAINNAYVSEPEVTIRSHGEGVVEYVAQNENNFISCRMFGLEGKELLVELEKRIKDLQSKIEDCEDQISYLDNCEKFEIDIPE